MSRESALRRYEDVLLGKCKFKLKAPGYIERGLELEKGSFEEKQRKEEIKKYKENDALLVIRYAISDILGWSPKEAMEHIDLEIIKALKLEDVIKYIDYPKDLKRTKDYWWIVYKAFPNEISVDPNGRVLRLYKRILNGEIKHFPRMIFEGVEGEERLGMLLHYFITNTIPASTVKDLYEVFGDKNRAINLLKKNKLYYAYKNRYNSPLDWLHASLGVDGDNFLYCYYQYKEIYKSLVNAKGKIKKKKG